jgi:thioesterase domain-containing protein
MGYAALAKALGPDQPFYGLQALGVENQEEPHDRIDEMASYYISQIKRIQPTGPYNLAGYSFGGIVAYEMACQLRDQGQDVGLLAILDSYAMSRKTALKLLWRPKNFLKFLANIPAWIRDEFLLFFVRKSTPILSPERARVLDAHIEALRHFRLRRYGGKVSLFRVRTLSLLRSFDPEFGWAELASGGVDSYIIPGSHFNMLEDPFVARLADQIRTGLDVARAEKKDA